MNLRAAQRRRRFSRWRFTWRRMSSAISWIECSISGAASCARSVDPLQVQRGLGDAVVGDRGVSLLGQLDLELRVLRHLLANAGESLLDRLPKIVGHLHVPPLDLDPHDGSFRSVCANPTPTSTSADVIWPTRRPAPRPRSLRPLAAHGAGREGGAGRHHVVDQDRPERDAATARHGRRGDALPAGSPDLTRAVPPGQATRRCAVRAPGQRSRDLVSRVEAAPPAAGRGRWDWDKDGAVEAFSGRGRERRRHRVSEGKAAAELERADDGSGRALVLGRGQGPVGAGDDRGARSCPGERRRAAVAERDSGVGRGPAGRAKRRSEEGPSPAEHARSFSTAPLHVSAREQRFARQSATKCATDAVLVEFSV